MPAYAGPPPPSGTTQSMFCEGHLMSHVLQWMQFCALIWPRVRVRVRVRVRAGSVYLALRLARYTALTHALTHSRTHALTHSRTHLQPLLAAVLLDVLVDPGGTEALLGPVVDGQITRDRDAVVLEGEVWRLVALVVGPWLGLGLGLGCGGWSPSWLVPG